MPSVQLQLKVRELTHDDLPTMAWSGSAGHMDHVSREIDRSADGLADYLAICASTNVPIAKGGISYRHGGGTGEIHQLAVHPALQSCGIGTLLISALEQRSLRRGVHRTELAVETDNARARALYDRLGYVEFATEPASWTEISETGARYTYHTMCVRMVKRLTVQS